MLFYDLGTDIKAFTTDRTEGRDKERVLAALGCGTDLVYPHQTHSDRVYAITPDLLSKGEAERREILEGVDAVHASAPCRADGGRLCAFAVSTADCIPVIVYDESHHAAAAIHAGWKGTVQRIVEKTIREMQRCYGTEPSQCKAVIGPGISQESFEVGAEVVERFVSEGFDMSDMVNFYRRTDAGFVPADAKADDARPHIDLKEVNRRQLLDMRVKACNIEVSPIDTYTDVRFFSARREQKGDVKCGRILTGFLLQ